METQKSLPTRWLSPLGVGVVAATLLLTAACSGDPEESSLTVAQTALTKAEKDLETAKSAATDASGAFCSAAQSYITALDRYGDVLSQSATTVGDVKTAGADLKSPGEEAQDAGKAVVSAKQDVVDAEQDVADAQVKLAAAQASASGSAAPEPEPEKTTPSATPTVPVATVDRVKQAETDFDSAQEGITSETPLDQAAEEFNAAAVALELSWIQLFAQAGCLSDDAQAQASDAVRDYTLALQQALTDAGYDPGEVDGVYGPKTAKAVKALQADSDLPETGTVDKATDAALRAKLDDEGAAAAAGDAATTAALQQTLKLAGFWDGPVDGVWSDELTETVKDLQKQLGVKETGEVDSKTVKAFQDAVADALAEMTATPEAEPSEAPTPTDTPTDQE